MSPIRQTSLSMIALIASTVALSACSKHSLVEKTGAATTTQKAEVPAAQQEAVQAAKAVNCPAILGTFTNTSGEEVVYTMASVEGGVSYTRNGQTTIADGKSHSAAGNVTESYVASCGADELKIVTTKADSTTSTRVVKVEQIGDGGDVNLHIEVDGVGSTTPLKKVVAAVTPAAAVSSKTDDVGAAADSTVETTPPGTESVSPDAAQSETSASSSALST